jgi:hypothetical protein
LRVYQRRLAVHIGHVSKAALRQGQAAVLPTGYSSCASAKASAYLRIL